MLYSYVECCHSILATLINSNSQVDTCPSGINDYEHLSSLYKGCNIAIYIQKHKKRVAAVV